LRKKVKWTLPLIVLALLFGILIAFPSLYWGMRHRLHSLRILIMGRKEKPKPVFVENSGPTMDIVFCLCDHFEPAWKGEEAKNFQPFLNGWEKSASGFTDSGGSHPKITFFGHEGMDGAVLERILPFARKGYGEIELQIHHGSEDDTGKDNSEKFRRIVQARRDLYRKYGFCHYREEGEIRFRFGFVHGNWALDNSRVDEKGRRCWCGVNSELRILGELGCYGDFTFPAWGTMTPTTLVDRPFYVKDDPDPKSYDKKENIQPIHAGGQPWGDLAILQGPDCNEAWNPNSPPTLERMKEWIAHNVIVEGQPKWVFVKLHTHTMLYWWKKGEGMDARAADVFYGDTAKTFLRDILSYFNDGVKYRLHFVSAREYYNITRAAQAGKTGNAGDYRDFILGKPLFLENAPPETQ